MLNYDEKIKIKDVLSELNINPNINLPYYLNSIDQINKKIIELESKLQRIMQNQAIIDQKIDIILRNIKWATFIYKSNRWNCAVIQIE